MLFAGPSCSGRLWDGCLLAKIIRHKIYGNLAQQFAIICCENLFIEHVTGYDAI